MKILITGGSGFIGMAVKALRARHDVIAPPHSAMDVLDEEAVRGVMRRERPGAVIHLAAWVSKERCEEDREYAFKLNDGGARNVAAAAADIGAFLMYLSTDFVFSGEQKELYTEENAPSPMTVYGESKLRGERSVGEICGPEGHVVVRTSRVFGKNGRSFISTLPARMRRGDSLKLLHDDLSSFAYVSDLVAGMENLLLARAGGLYHVVNTGTCSTWEFGNRIREKLGFSPPLEKISVADFNEFPPAPRYRTLSTSKYESAGFPPLPTWEEAQDAFLKV